MSLKGKIAIVTGGARGIGKGVSLALGKQGAQVAATYVSDSTLATVPETQKEIEAAGGKFIVIKADAGDFGSPSSVVRETLKAFGTDHIDIIVNNAGVALHEPVGEITLEKYNRTMDINVRAVIFQIQAALPYLPKNGSARIVNVSSVSSETGFLTQTVYAASKAAVEGLTRVMARELGASHGATVNCINPGPVDTDMFSGVTPESYKEMFDRIPPAAAHRVGTTQDIADIVLFLCEERSRWVSGSVVCANGGALLK